MIMFIQKHIHSRRLSISFSLIWVLFVLLFTYNESIFPIIWEKGFLIWPKLIDNLGKDSYLLANIGIVVLLVIEVLIENAMLAHKRNIYRLEISNEPINIEAFYMLSLLCSIIMIILLYLYCRNNEQPVNQSLLRFFLIGWIGSLLCMKHVVFYNLVKVPTIKIEDRSGRIFKQL